jgi:hypothetical protein
MIPERPPPIAEAQVERVAGGVLLHRDQARHAAAALVFAAHRMPRALRRDHQHVDGGLRLDQLEVNAEAVGEEQRGAVADVRRDLLLVDAPLQFVRGQDHDRVGPGRRLGDRHHLEAFGLGLPGRRRAGTQGHGDVGDAGVAQIEGMGVALRAVAYDGDLLVQNAGKVGVAIVVDAHGSISS